MNKITLRCKFGMYWMVAWHKYNLSVTNDEAAIYLRLMDLFNMEITYS